MAWKSVAAFSVFFTALFAPSINSLLFAQQSNIQTLFLAPAAARLVSTGSVAGIADTEKLPYINALANNPKTSAAVFQPTASDLLIQQAEERFRNGKKLYDNRDFTRARTEFDAAIDLMLKASADPTDRLLYESKFDDMVDAIHHDDLVGMGAAVTDEVPGFDKAPLDDILNMTFPIDPSTKTKVQSEVKSTTSALPLTLNDVVLGYVNYFSGRGRKTIELGLEREGRYSAMISRVLAEEGVPQELIHLAQAESGFLPRAVSRAAAEGMWQFVKFRGNEYGLMQTPYSDDRLDPEKATRAAARHLHDLYKEFGDWYLAIAAYNCGPGAIERAVERTGYADFWQLRARHVLPTETTNYVPIILAMTIMSKNAAAYGLDNVVPDAPIEYDTITTASPTNLALIGDLTETPVSQLLQLNPALLRSIAPANFEVRVPKGTGQQVMAALENIPAERLASWRSHRVEAGEDIATIARLYNSTSSQIIAANNLGVNEPLVGDRLLIPASYHEAVPALRVPAHKKSTTAKSKPSAGAHVAASGHKGKPRSTGTIAALTN